MKTDRFRPSPTGESAVTIRYHIIATTTGMASSEVRDKSYEKLSRSQSKVLDISIGGEHAQRHVVVQVASPGPAKAISATCHLLPALSAAVAGRSRSRTRAVVARSASRYRDRDAVVQEPLRDGWEQVGPLAFLFQRRVRGFRPRAQWRGSAACMCDPPGHRINALRAGPPAM
jgi:hypothetical protein